MPSTLHIEYIDHKQRQQMLTLNSAERDTWLIGRRDGTFTPEINLTWAAEYGLARRHARLSYTAGGWYVEQISTSSRSLVNDQLLVPGVPVALPVQALLTLGKLSLRLSYTDSEHMPDGEVSSVASRGSDLSAAVPETQRFEIMGRMIDSLAHSGPDSLQKLVEVIRTCFPAAASGGIGLYHDKEVSIPACFPRGTAQISFRLARRALDTQNLIQWDRTAGSGSSAGYTSLTGATQALYAPILRGARKLGVLYLHTAAHFTADDHALILAISDMLSANGQFQPESAHLRLPSVFLSYSHNNTDFVRKLAADLRRQRVTVWLDERLRVGKDWQHQLALAIEASAAFALVLSPDSLSSEWVQWEIVKARALNKPIFPLLHQVCEDTPEDLSRLQRIDLLTDYTRGILELVEELYAISGERDALASAPVPVMRSASKGEKVRILFVAANPRDTDPLRLGEEIRTIQERIRGGKFRDQFDMIQQAWAVRFSDLQQHLLEYQPHIVHFSGHGSSAGQLIFEDNAGNSQPVSPRVLKQLFGALKDDKAGGVKMVVLNACYSAVQAEAIADEVDCVLGMRRAVSDNAAIEFAGAFYNALTFCKSVQVAFNLATTPMALSGEDETPQLLCKAINPNELIFCEER